LATSFPVNYLRTWWQ